MSALRTGPRVRVHQARCVTVPGCLEEVHRRRVSRVSVTVVGALLVGRCVTLRDASHDFGAVVSAMARVYASLRLLSVAAPTLACTNVLVTQEASASGNILLGYNDDSSNRYAAITRFPAPPGEEGRQRPIYLYDNGNFSGYIPDEKPTYNVISTSNEWVRCQHS